jgi:DNA cross-link repair 1A protein
MRAATEEQKLKARKDNFFSAAASSAAPKPTASELAPREQPNAGPLAPVFRPDDGAADTKEGSRVLVLFGSYSVGKERLYMKVAEALCQKVHVDSRKLGSLRCFDWSPQQMAQLTTRPQDTPLRVVPLDHISFATMAEYARSGCKQSSSAASPSKENPPLFDTVIGFRPTGWTHTAAKEDAPSEAKKRKKAPSSTTKESEDAKKRSILRVREKLLSGLKGPKTGPRLVVVDVPYSEHSSFPELLDCVQQLRPQQIVPTVNCRTDEDVSAQLQLLQPQTNKEKRGRAPQQVHIRDGRRNLPMKSG